MIPKLLTPLIFLLLLLFVIIKYAIKLLTFPFFWLRAKLFSQPDWMIICLSHVAWNHIWQRNHHTMTRLALRRRVVYFEHSGHSYLHVYAHLLAHCVLKPDSLNKLFFNRNPKGVHQRFFLLLPGESRLSFIALLNARLIAFEILFERTRYGGSPYILWFYYPAGVKVLDILKPLSVVYDIQDKYSAFLWAPKDITEREARMLQHAKVVFPGTYALHESRPHANKHFFPCAVEYNHFNAAAQPDAKTRFIPPIQIRSFAGKAPVLMYAGLIDIRIDPKILIHVAESEPTWQIVMIGPFEQAFRQSSTFPKNIHFTDSQPYADLPKWFTWADVLLMPWAKNELTEHINPTKTLEYFSARRPVVATAIPDLRKFYSDTCLLSDTADEFLANCRKALAGIPTEQLDRAEEKAKSFAWEEVVAEMERQIVKTFPVT